MGCLWGSLGGDQYAWIAGEWVWTSQMRAWLPPEGVGVSVCPDSTAMSASLVYLNLQFPCLLFCPWKGRQQMFRMVWLKWKEWALRHWNWLSSTAHHLRKQAVGTQQDSTAGRKHMPRVVGVRLTAQNTPSGHGTETGWILPNTPSCGQACLFSIATRSRKTGLQRV